MKQNKEVQFVDLKLIEYKEAWDLQETLLNRIATVKLDNRGLEEDHKTITNNYLLFCQHPHVYTLGKSGDESHLLLQESFLSTIGATYFKTNRGGWIPYNRRTEYKDCSLYLSYHHGKFESRLHQLR